MSETCVGDVRMLKLDIDALARKGDWIHPNTNKRYENGNLCSKAFVPHQALIRMSMLVDSGAHDLSALTLGSDGIESLVWSGVSHLTHRLLSPGLFCQKVGTAVKVQIAGKDDVKTSHVQVFLSELAKSSSS